MANKKEKTYAPCGCAITRNGNYYTLTWKIQAKNTNDGQKRRYTAYGWDKYYTKSIKKTDTSTTVFIGKDDYKWPLKWVKIQVQNNQYVDKSSGAADLYASDWSGAVFQYEKPPTAVCSMSLSSDYSNVCTVSYGHYGSSFSSSDHYGFAHTEYRTTFHSEKTKDSWGSWKTLSSESGSFTKREDSYTIDNPNNIGYVRKYQFRIKGKFGYGKTATCSHYYSRPWAAEIKSATMKDLSGKILLTAKWYSSDPVFHPIDRTYLQYGIAVPDVNMTCPDDISWTDRPPIKDTPSTYKNKYKKLKNGKYKKLKGKKEVKKADRDSFTIDEVIGVDNCLFVRVVNVHDNHLSYSSPKRATGITTRLKNPSGLSVTPNYETNRISVDVTNESEVPDARLAVVLHTVKNKKEDNKIVGIIGNSTILPAIIQCPNLSYYDEFNFGVYAFVGDTTYTTVAIPGTQLSYRKYTIKNKKMISSTVWKGGAVPKAPENVNAVSINEGAAVQVTWDWTWTEADIAEMSWSDHSDAWESTDEPTLYRINSTYAGRWNIYGLETGMTWYIRVRLIRTTTSGENPGPWSEIVPVDLSFAPNKPALKCPEVSTIDDPFTLSWEYESTDGTDQKDVEIKEVTIGNDGDLEDVKELKTGLESARDIDLIPEELGWNVGEKHGIMVRVLSGSDKFSEWSDPVFINIAEPISCRINSTSLEQRVLYSLSNDDVIDESKIYYSVTGTSVSEPVNEGLSTYYELSDNHYTLTNDGIVDTEKTYYTISGVSSLRYLYTKTTDSTVDDTKTYYTVSSSPVENPINRDIHVYYELTDGVYSITEDSSIDDTKTYYLIIGSEVDSPIDDDIDLYYIRSDESITPTYGYYESKTINVLREMPLSLSAETTGGVNNRYSTNVIIERAAPYFVDRPDETTYAGYIGETVFSDVYDNASSISIKQSDLIGYLDDTAEYKLTVYSYDEADQYDDDSIEFMVDWSHQAPIPTANVEFDSEYSVIKITPGVQDSNKRQEGDTFDIYRLSVDKPVLIVKGGHFGETYVDPYPTIGEYGGHRIVSVTENGDFIANDNDSDMAWVDTGVEDGDIFRYDFPIINSGEGRFEILYNAELSTNWEKDFRETRYLGGHIQGDWNAGIHRDSTINSVVIRGEDMDAVRAFRRLAEYPGICHVRTLDGSNYYADIQVTESAPYDDNPLNSYSFKITRVDSEGYDGIELSEWNKIIGNQ